MIAMSNRTFIGKFLSPVFAEKMGGIILIVLRSWVIYQFFHPEKEKDVLPHEKVIVNFEINHLGIVINIFEKANGADFDKSGTITGVEAFMLGLPFA